MGDKWIFLKNISLPYSCMMAYRMNLLSAIFISLDNTYVDMPISWRGKAALNDPCNGRLFFSL
jgi:hypothetical protein